MEESTASSFGNMLQRFRKRRKLSQQELAERVGRSRESISLWERRLEYPDTFGIMSALAEELLLDEEERRLFFEARYGTPAILPFHNLPCEKNPYFTGREAVLENLHQRLTEGKDVALRQAVSGLGGVGKTQTALEYAYRYQASYHDILWAEAESYEALAAAYVNLARLLLLPERDRQDQNVIIAAVKRWLSTHKEWLLILDNIEDLSLVGKFVPAVRQGAVLLTTQRQVTGSIAQTIEVEMMSEEEGSLFLLKRAHYLALGSQLNDDSLDKGTIATAKDISQELGGLPLALDQAGAFILETGCSLIDYLALYTQRRNALLQRRGSVYTDHPESVTTTFSLAFDRLVQKNAVAPELLRLFAFLAPDAIPEEIVLQGAPHLGASLQSLLQDGLAFNEAIEALRAFSLVYRDRERRTFSVHRLVQVVLKGTMDEAMQKQWAERIIKMLSAVFSFEHINEVGNWPYCERVLPHALVGASLGRQYDFAFPEVPRLTLDVAIYFLKRGRYAECESLIQYAFSTYKKVQGQEHVNVADSMNALAVLYLEQARYEQAEPLFYHALSIYEQELGSEHPMVTAVLRNIAHLFFRQGKYKQAIILCQHTLSMNEQELGPDHPEVARSLNSLALAYQRIGQYKLAEPLYLRSLSIYEEELGPNHPEVATVLHNLGDLCTVQGQYKLAEPLYLRSLQIREHILGSEHPEVADSLVSLQDMYFREATSWKGMQHFDRALFDKAEQLLDRALHIYEQELGSEHPKTVVCINSKALLYIIQDKYEQAEQLLNHALLIFEKVGPERPEKGLTLANLATLYMAQEKYAQAKVISKRACLISQQSLGRKHPYVRAMKRISFIASLMSFTASLGKVRVVSRFLKKYFVLRRNEND